MNYQSTQKLKSSHGITLIALVITIILLLILSGVAIYHLTNDNGLLKKATKSADLHEKEKNKEQIKLLQAEADTFVYTSQLNLQDLNYTESTRRLPNPDRGFYYPAIIVGNSTGFDYSQVNNAISDALNTNRTLVHLRINISKLSGRANGNRDLNLSDADIADLNSAFDLLRKNKLKAIVRVAYDYDGETNKEPDTLSAILKHIEQFKTIFETNKDIITVVEAGFIGQWGEMHDSDYANPKDINEILKALLKTVPDTITVNARTLTMYRNLFGSDPIRENTAYDGSGASRLGMFNDGYLGSESDLGTYYNREEDLKFLESHANYTFFGGEAVAPNNPYNDIENAQVEMFRTHTTYLNYIWNNEITQVKWGNSIYNGPNSIYKGQTAQKYIEDHLGYRFVLKKSKISPNVKQGEKLAISINIENTGFGNVINEKKVKLMLKNPEMIYVTDTNIDVRQWNSNETITKNIVFTIPNDINTGEWEIYLKIEDKENDQYVIQFANDETWNPYVNANYIGKFNVVKNENAKEVGLKQEYAGFEGDGTKDIILPDMNVQLDGKGDEWTKSYFVAEKDGIKVYYYEKDNFGYLYCTPINPDELKHALVKYGQQDENYSIAYTSGSWNGTWEITDITQTELYPWSSNATLKENIAESYSVQGEDGIEFQMKLSGLNPEKQYTKIKLELFATGYGPYPDVTIEFERK